MAIVLVAIIYVTLVLMTFFLVSFLSRSHLSYWEIYTCHRNFIHWHLEWGSGAYLCDICPGDIFLIKFSRWHLSNWEFDTCHWKFFHWHLEFESGVYKCDICSGDIFLIKFSRWHFVQVTFVLLTIFLGDIFPKRREKNQEFSYNGHWT